MKWNKRHDINNADARMDASVGANVESLNGCFDNSGGSGNSDHRDDRTVVVSIAMNVKKIAPGGKRDFLNKVEVASFADVDDALNHD